jgi:transposase
VWKRDSHKPVDRSRRHAQTPLADIITYLKHRITNAASESINAKIQWVKYTFFLWFDLKGLSPILFT